MYNLKVPYYRALDSRVRGVISPLLRAKFFADRTVLLSFDHGCIAHDIGDACFETLVKTELINRRGLPRALTSVLGHAVGDDLVSFYADVIRDAGRHPTTTDAIHRWRTEIMQGLTPWDLVKTAELTLARSLRGCRFPKPFAHPEMIELLELLLGGGADVWIVSMSDPWSVRVAVEKLINPYLRKNRFRRIGADRVIGLSTSLYDRLGCIFSDAELVRSDPDYRALDSGRLSELTLAPRVTAESRAFGAKVSREVLPSIPVLAAGSTESDLATLESAELKLWIARPERPDLVARVRNRARSERGWMMQYVDPCPDGQVLA